VTVIVADGTLVQCEIVDVSIGGARVQGADRIPLGQVQLVVDSTLALEGVVCEEVLDLADGTVTARIVFEEANVASPALVALATETSSARTSRMVRVAAATAVVLAVVVGGALALRAGGDDIASPLTAARAADTQTVTDVDEPVSTTVAPAPVVPTSQSAAATPAPTVDVVQPAPATPPAASPSPTPTQPAAAAAPVTTTEHADNTLRVTVSDDPSQTSAESTVGPSNGVDPVRVQSQFSPEHTAAGYKVAVTIENRSDKAIRFEKGIDALVTVTSDRTVVDQVAFRAPDVVELAPGETAEVAGFIALEPGTYDITVDVDVTS
jgi:hypothetical protein